jgi:hypothetical protein
VTHWDDERAYVTRRSQVQAWGRKQTVIGSLMIAGSATLALLLFRAHRWRWPFFSFPRASK